LVFSRERKPSIQEPQERLSYKAAAITASPGLFEFVLKQLEVTIPSEGGIPTFLPWAALLRSWNEALPAGHEWRYKDRRNLRRDFLKAFDQIVNYYY